jgi:TRAP-type C4-dicarboxylate transport system permease small subunit
VTAQPTSRGGGGVSSPPPPRLARLARIVGQVEDAVLATLIVLTILVIVTQIISRYVLNSSLPWPDEVSRILLVWITFLGTAAVMKRSGHMGLEFLAERLGPRWGMLVEAVSSLAVIAFAVIVVIAGWEMTVQGAQRTTPALGISFVLVYASMPVGAALVALRACAQLIAQLRAFVDPAARERLRTEQERRRSELDLSE